MKPTDKSLDTFLRKHTAVIHKRTEENLEPLQLFNGLTIPNYTTFIKIQYYWHRAMESMLLAANPSLDFNGYAYMLKAPLLEKDMIALRIQPENFDFRKWKNPALPGIIYVLEGSMLGGTVISGHLAEQSIPAECRNYFSYCAKAAKTIWPQTRKYLRSIENTGYYFDACLKTSISCFEKMMEINAQIRLAATSEGLQTTSK